MVGQEGLVHRGEGGRVDEEQVGLLAHPVKPDRDQHPVVFGLARGVGQEVHLGHVVVLHVVDLGYLVCQAALDCIFVLRLTLSSVESQTFFFTNAVLE